MQTRGYYHGIVVETQILWNGSAHPTKSMAAISSAHGWLPLHRAFIIISVVSIATDDVLVRRFLNLSKMKEFDDIHRVSAFQNFEREFDQEGCFDLN